MKKLTTLTIACILALSIMACGKDQSQNDTKAEEVLELSKDTSADTIQEQMKATPSSQENNKESGISADNYDNSKFAGYDGQISFYYNEDGSVLYYKWFINEKDENKAKEIYSDVCQALTGSYGDGEESNNKASKLYTTSFTNDKQQITAQLQGNENEWEISYTVAG